MGQKVNPHGLRVGIIKGWDSKWYADRDYEKYLLEDIKIREFIKDKLFLSGISKVEIERASNRARISIHTAKPGMVIGRQGSNIELLKNDLKKMTDSVIDINIVEVKTPDMDATLVAENIASQLERRIAFRRAMKQCVGRTMRMGAKGIKVQVSGRLGGAEIARSESYREGSIPLHTLRADIDYGTAEAHTTYGRIGVKVWIYKGEVLPESKEVAKAAPAKEAGFAAGGLSQRRSGLVGMIRPLVDPHRCVVKCHIVAFFLDHPVGRIDLHFGFCTLSGFFLFGIHGTTSHK